MDIKLYGLWLLSCTVAKFWDLGPCFFKNNQHVCHGIYFDFGDCYVLRNRCNANACLTMTIKIDVLGGRQTLLADPKCTSAYQVAFVSCEPFCFFVVIADTGHSVSS